VGGKKFCFLITQPQFSEGNESTETISSPKLLSMQDLKGKEASFRHIKSKGNGIVSFDFNIHQDLSTIHISM
jgi:hypothetical protein